MADSLEFRLNKVVSLQLSASVFKNMRILSKACSTLSETAHSVAKTAKGFAQFVGGDYRELPVRRDDINAAEFAGEKEVASIRHGRRRETFAAGAESLAIGNRARLCVEAGQHSVIETAIKIIADDYWRLHVIPLPGVDPDDGSVRRPNVRRGDIAAGFQANRTHRTGPPVSAG